MVVFCAVVAGVRESGRWRRAQELPVVGAGEVAAVFPGVAEVGPRDPGSGRQVVKGADGQEIGSVCLTLPGQREVRGYSGPTQVLAGLWPDGRLAGWTILSSGETPEHAAMVVGSGEFRRHLDGWKAGARVPEAPAVAGATLTATAVRESLVRALSVPVRGTSLRFPEGPDLAEAREMFPGAVGLVETGGRWRVEDGGGRVVGWLLRSGPVADGVRGYQGPTEVLCGLDAGGERIAGVRLRRSYDNEPYVGYVREDVGWLGSFKGLTLAEMAAMDFEKVGVEGVSGATLTSYAVAASLKEMSAAAVVPVGVGGLGGEERWTWRRADVVLGVVVVGGVVMGMTRLRGRERVRKVWQAVLVAVPGLWLGSMVALPQLAGWMEHGVSWRTGLGMLLMAVVALVMPWATGRQVYCHQICPHGAAQTWVGRLGLKKLTVSVRWHRVLRRVPGVLLVAAVFSVVFAWGWPLASLEPFDAWVPRVAGVASLVLAVAGLAAAAVVPQAYCQYGCPTGALLRYVRSSGLVDRLGWRDAVAMVCAVAAWVPMWQYRVMGAGAGAAVGVAVPTRVAGIAFGTSWSVTLRRPVPEGLGGGLEKVLGELEKELSCWRGDSVIAAFNGAAGPVEFPVPGRVSELAGVAAGISEATGGAFDCTMGPLVRAWGFGPPPHGERVPGEEEWRRLLAMAGWEKVGVSAGKLEKRTAGVTLDLTPVGEGAALEAMGRLLDGAGLDEWLISFGGELKARGEWRVELEDSGREEVLVDAAMSTSGVRRARRGGVSHLIDGRTGMPVQHDTVSVTVRHVSAVEADGWATALAVLGSVEGLAVARRAGVAAQFVSERDGAVQVETSPAWPEGDVALTRSVPSSGRTVLFPSISESSAD